jgi:hypothetical protein
MTFGVGDAGGDGRVPAERYLGERTEVPHIKRAVAAWEQECRLGEPDVSGDGAVDRVSEAQLAAADVGQVLAYINDLPDRDVTFPGSPKHMET